MFGVRVESGKMSEQQSNRFVLWARAILGVTFLFVWLLYLWGQLTGLVPDPIWISPNNLFNIYWFGLTGVLAFVLGWTAAGLLHVGQFQRWPAKPLPIFRLVIISLIFGRFFALLNPSPSARALGFTQFSDLGQNPVLFFDFTYGGLDPAGMLLGGLLVLGLYYWDWSRFWAEILPAAALGHAVGGILISLGRFLNQEFYGVPSRSWFAVMISEEYRLPIFQNIETYQPVFLFLSLFYLVGGLIILLVGAKRPRLAVGIYLLLFVLGQLFIQQAILISHVRLLPLAIVFGVALIALVQSSRQETPVVPDPELGQLGV